MCDFISQCSWNVQIVAPSPTKIRLNDSFWNQFLTWVFDMSAFCKYTFDSFWAEVRMLTAPVHHFQCSGSFLLSGSYSWKNVNFHGQFNKNLEIILTNVNINHGKTGGKKSNKYHCSWQIRETECKVHSYFHFYLCFTDTCAHCWHVHAYKTPDTALCYWLCSQVGYESDLNRIITATIVINVINLYDSGCKEYRMK